MTWVRLDDHMDEHQKIAALSDEAFRLWANALCYANRSLTDGFIPVNMLGRLYDGTTKGKKLAAELVRQRLWTIADGGWEIHDYLVYQPSKADVESKRLVRAEAGRQGGLKRAANRKEANVKQSASNELANSQANPKQNSTPYPDPDPSLVPGAAPGAGESANLSKSTSETGSHRRPGFNGAALTLSSQSSDSAASRYWTTSRQTQFQKTCRLFATAMGKESYPPNPEHKSLAQREWQDLIGDKIDGQPADFFAHDIKKAGREQIIGGWPQADFTRILASVLRKG